jgi:hypothetical protein
MGGSAWRQRVGQRVGHFTEAMSGRALPSRVQKSMLCAMNRNEARTKSQIQRGDTEGHRLVVLDRPVQRKPHVAEFQHELRLRRQAKESRTNRPDRYLTGA